MWYYLHVGGDGSRQQTKEKKLMKVGDLVKRAGINPLRINGLVLEIRVFNADLSLPVAQHAQVLWPNKTCEWTDVNWLRRIDDA